MRRLFARKRVRVAAVFLGLLAIVLIGGGTFRWRPDRRPEPPRLEAAFHGTGMLLAGAAEVPLKFAGHVPVAGYPRLVWLDRGLRDPVAARAVVLSEPGCSIALVSVEVVYLQRKLVRAVEREVKDLNLDAVIVAATHTHAGPGGYWDDRVSERLATGPYDQKVFDTLVALIGQSIRKAAAARQPAYLSAAQARWPVYARNRGGAEEKVDGHLVALRLSDRAGKPFAELVVFPAHGAILDLQNRKLSGDWPGEFMRAAKDLRLFFQGAVGDQSPHLPNDAPIPNPRVYAAALDAKLATLKFAPADPWPPLSVAFATTLLPEVDPGAAPPFLRRLATNLLYHWVPARGQVAALELGPVVLLGVPGEPVAEVAERWRSLAGPRAEILSLAGDYLGYVETSEHLADKSGETPRTYYGPDLADRLGKALETAARAAVSGPQPAP